MKTDLTIAENWEEREDFTLDHWDKIQQAVHHLGYGFNDFDVNDVSQNVALIILTRPSFDPAKASKDLKTIRATIKALAKNAAIDWIRLNQREPSAAKHAAQFEEEHEPLISHDYIVDSWGETLGSISEFLTPERFRVVYLLAEGHTYAETAAALGLTVNRVKALQAQVGRRKEELAEHIAAINAIV